MVVVLASNKYRKARPRLSTNHQTSFSLQSLDIGFPAYLCKLDSLALFTLHCYRVRVRLGFP